MKAWTEEGGQVAKRCKRGRVKPGRRTPPCRTQSRQLDEGLEGEVMQVMVTWRTDGLERLVGWGGEGRTG